MAKPFESTEQQATPVYPDGSPVDPKQFGTALKEGKLGFQAGTQVYMKTEAGKRYRVAAEKVPEAMAAGARPEAPEETRLAGEKKFAKKHPFLVGALAATSKAAETYGSVASMGLTDLAEGAAQRLEQTGSPGAAFALRAAAPGGLPAAALGTTDIAETSKKAQAASPGAAALGSVTGLGLGMATTPYTALGALSRIPAVGAAGSAVKSALGTGALGRAAAVGGQFALEGAVQGFGMGAGAEARRLAEAREEITAERLLSSGVKTGAIGGILGAGLGGIGGFAKAKFINSVESGVLKPSGNAARALGFTKADYRKLVDKYGADRVEEILGKKLFERDAEIAALNKANEAAAKMKGEEFFPIPSPIRGTPQEMAAGMQAWVDDMTKPLGSFVEEVSAKIPWTQKLHSDIAMDAMEFIGKVNRRGGDKGGPEMARYLYDTFIKSRQGYQNLPAEMRDRIVNLDDVRSLVEFKRLRESVDAGTSWNPTELERAQNAVRKEFRAVLEGSFEKTLAKELPKFNDEKLSLEAYKALKEKYAIPKSINDLVQSRAATAHYDPAVSRQDIYGTVIGGFHPGQFVSGPTGAAIGFGVSKAGKWASGREAAAYMARTMNRVKGSIDANVLKTANNVQQAYSKGSVATAKGNIPKFTAKIASKFSEVSKPVRQAIENPAFAQAQISDALEPVAQSDPGVAKHAARKFIEDIAWLKQMMPEYKFEGAQAAGSGALPFASVSLSVMNAKGAKGIAPRLSPIDMAIFTRAYSVLNDTDGAVRKFKVDGRFPPELPKVLRERRPALLAQIQAEAASTAANMAIQGKVPSHTKRVQFSMLTGQAHDVTMTQEYIKMSQDVWAEEEAARMGDESAGPTPGTRSGGRQVSEKMRMRAMDRSTASEDLGRRRD